MLGLPRSVGFGPPLIHLIKPGDARTDHEGVKIQELGSAANSWRGRCGIHLDNPTLKRPVGLFDASLGQGRAWHQRGAWGLLKAANLRWAHNPGDSILLKMC